MNCWGLSVVDWVDLLVALWPRVLFLMKWNWARAKSYSSCSICQTFDSCIIFTVLEEGTVFWTVFLRWDFLPMNGKYNTNTLATLLKRINKKLKTNWQLTIEIVLNCTLEKIRKCYFKHSNEVFHFFSYAHKKKLIDKITLSFL